MHRPLILTFDTEVKRLDVANDVALLEVCRRAMDMAHAGNYYEALGLLSPVWGGTDCEPRTKGLPLETSAELYLCAGVLTCAVSRASEAQRNGRRFLRKAFVFFRSIDNKESAARCVKELASSLQRAGHHRHARRVASIALRRPTELTLEIEASLHLISANSELSARRFEAALSTLENAYPLFEAVSNDRIRGAFHNTLGLALKNAGLAGGIDDYLQRAIIEFTAASYHFEQSKNLSFLSRVENNIGFLLWSLGENTQAYPHIDRAKSLALSAGDEVMASYFDDTLARVLCGDGKLSEAERVIERAVQELERLGATVELGEAIDTRTEIRNRIAALRAESSNVIPFPSSLAALPTRFVVSVSDDSLINAGVRAGDDLWVCRSARAKDGDLVFADTPDGLTLGFHYAEGDTVRLVFAGEHCSERCYPAALIRIYGVSLTR
jgi:plasmid stabilization system protein ParE